MTLSPQAAQIEMQKRRSAVRTMNERIAKLREQSVKSEVKISDERAALITRFYKEGGAEGKSAPVRCAMAFKYLMENVSLPVEDGQLIVGLRGTGPQEVPTYPEVCTHSMEDLEVLDTRENIPYRVDEKTAKLYQDEIIPFWKGKTMRKSYSTTFRMNGFRPMRLAYGRNLWSRERRGTLPAAREYLQRAFWI